MGAASVAYNKNIWYQLKHPKGVAFVGTFTYFFCGIGQGGKIVFAIALTFIALYAAVYG